MTTLHVTPALGRPAGVVVVLHGGGEVGREAVGALAPAALRMVPVAGRAWLAGRGRLAVLRVRNTVRGWNGADASPLADLDHALDHVRERWGSEVPVALVGHSMGGRAAFRGAGHPQVRAVVAMAPWLPPGEPTAQLAGRSVLVVHGARDRMTSPRASAAAVERLRAAGGRAGYVGLPDEGHALLRHLVAVDGLVARFAAAELRGRTLDPAGRLGTALAR